MHCNHNTNDINRFNYAALIHICAASSPPGGAGPVKYFHTRQSIFNPSRLSSLCCVFFFSLSAQLLRKALITVCFCIDKLERYLDLQMESAVVVGLGPLIVKNFNSYKIASTPDSTFIHVSSWPSGCRAGMA